MNMKIYLAFLLMLIHNNSFSKPVETVRIFYSDTDRILVDFRLPENANIHYYSMDSKNNATQKINSIVNENVRSRVDIGNIEDSYRAAFNELLNSSLWKDIILELQVGAISIDAALRFKILKLPALVINDEAVVYGVRSLEEGIRLYEKAREW